jgi:hypothetical protein
VRRVFGCVGCIYIGLQPLSHSTVGPGGVIVGGNWLGDTKQFQAVAVVLSNRRTQTITTQAAWSSADATVFVVNESGLVTVVGPGAANLTATYKGLSGSLFLSNEFPPQ